LTPGITIRLEILGVVALGWKRYNGSERTG